MSKELVVFLVLYRKKKSTYSELARICECSTRTIARVIDNLTPYVPIYCERGRNGGVILSEEFKI